MAGVAPVYIRAALLVKALLQLRFGVEKSKFDELLNPFGQSLSRKVVAGMYVPLPRRNRGWPSTICGISMARKKRAFVMLVDTLVSDAFVDRRKGRIPQLSLL